MRDWQGKTWKAGRDLAGFGWLVGWRGFSRSGRSHSKSHCLVGDHYSMIVAVSRFFIQSHISELPRNPEISGIDAKRNSLLHAVLGAFFMCTAPTATAVRLCGWTWETCQMCSMQNSGFKRGGIMMGCVWWLFNTWSILSRIWSQEQIFQYSPTHSSTIFVANAFGRDE